MKKLVLAISLSAVVPVSAMAMESKTSAFDDTQQIFHAANQPLELSFLSQQEMKETTGAVLPVAIMVAGAVAAGGAYLYSAGSNGTVGGALVAAGTGAMGAFGVPGVGIATFGSLYAGEIRPSTGKPNLACTGGTPCILPK